MVKSKKELQEQADIVDTIGTEGAKGVKAAKEYFREQEVKEKKEKDTTLTLLEDKRKSFQTYNKFLGSLLVKRLSTISWPPGWAFNVAPTDKGVIMELAAPNNKFYRSAFASVGDGIFDLNAVDNFALRAENTIDKYEHQEHGIYLPN